jgi:hypothetical protein
VFVSALLISTQGQRYGLPLMDAIIMDAVSRTYEHTTYLDLFQRGTLIPTQESLVEPVP